MKMASDVKIKCEDNTENRGKRQVYWPRPVFDALSSLCKSTRGSIKEGRMDFDIQTHVPDIRIPDHLQEPYKAAKALKEANTWRAAWAAHPSINWGCYLEPSDAMELIFAAFFGFYIWVGFAAVKLIEMFPPFPFLLDRHHVVAPTLLFTACLALFAMFSAVLFRRAYRAARTYAHKRDEANQALAHPIILANDRLAACIEQYNALAAELNETLMGWATCALSREDVSRPFLSQMACIRSEILLCLDIQYTHPKCIVDTDWLSSLLDEMHALFSEEPTLLHEHAIAA